ncbi:MAG: type II secretion system GspH family protein [Pseudomonadaceae bacterium]|nr:type II secretion system GspH family protein [Pseudomonadaceae bacterium]
MGLNRRTSQSGFTLVELLIVAIMLAILAAIVVPQFASTTTEGEEAALKSDLAAIRSAIDLYRQQHGAYPAIAASSGGTCTGGTAGTGAAESGAAFTDQLTRYSNASGQTCTLPVGGNFNFGPYLKIDALPTNPVSKSSALVIVATGGASSGDLAMSGDGAAGGWKYDPTSGKFIANDTNNDSRGVPFDSY